MTVNLYQIDRFDFKFVRSQKLNLSKKFTIYVIYFLGLNVVVVVVVCCCCLLLLLFFSSDLAVLFFNFMCTSDFYWWWFSAS